MRIHSFTPHAGTESTLEGELRTPIPGAQGSPQALDFSGWVQVKNHPRAECVRITHHGVSLGRIACGPLKEGRQEFEGRICLLGVDAAFDLQMQVHLPNGSFQVLGTVRGEREPYSNRTKFDRLLLLTSSGRSGSTWIVHLLTQHPKLAYYEPFRHEIRLTERWARTLRRMSHPNHYAFAFAPGRGGLMLTADLEVAQPFPPVKPQDEAFFHWLEEDFISGALTTTSERLQGAIRGCLDYIPNGKSAARLIEKNGSTWCSLIRHEWLPGAAEILLIRDPRDTISSWIQYSRRNGKDFVPSLDNREFVNFALHHEALFNSYMHLHKRDPDGTILVRYEDLIQAPERTLQGILKRLKLDHSDKLVLEMIAKAQESRSGAQKGHQTSATAESSIDRWARDLDPEVANHIQSRLADAMTHFGYQLR